MAAKSILSKQLVSGIFSHYKESREIRGFVVERD